MATLNGVFRLGRDAEQKFTESGGSVVNLALACNYGKKSEDGKRPTTWVDASLWGKLGESLLPYLKKGGQVSAVMDDVHIHQYEKKDGSVGAALRGTVRIIELLGSPRESGEDREEKPKQAPKPAKKAEKDPFADFEDDIPY